MSFSHQIIHHGAKDGVTGSCHELRFFTSSTADALQGLLIDCGLFQGDDEPRGGSDATVDFPIAHLSALVVTHVHIDHVGRIPHLLAAGFKGPLLCSEPSARLLPLVLEDALKVGFTRDRGLIERFLKDIETRLVPLPYGKWHSVQAGQELGLEVKLHRAGHILGSACVECRVRPRLADVKELRVVFSGDLGATHTPLLPAPARLWGADVVVLESTYGDRLHEDRRSRRRRLEAVVERALENRGVVLVPAFSIGRTQELLYELEGIIHRGRGRRVVKDLPWEDLEIIVDSPLASRFTEVYRDLAPFWDAEARHRVAAGRNPLSFEQLTTIDSHEDHLRAVSYLKKTARPCIVIAAGGMCSGGRIVNYLKALIGDARTDVLLVGYQASGTPGRAIQQYGPKGGYVVLDGDKYPIRAAVHSLSGYSAHADAAGLEAFVRRMRRRPSQVRLVHGEPAAKEALAKRLRGALGPQTDIVT